MKLWLSEDSFPHLKTACGNPPWAGSLCWRRGHFYTMNGAFWCSIAAMCRYSSTSQWWLCRCAIPASFRGYSFSPRCFLAPKSSSSKMPHCWSYKYFLRHWLPPFFPFCRWACFCSPRYSSLLFGRCGYFCIFPPHMDSSWRFWKALLTIWSVNFIRIPQHHNHADPIGQCRWYDILR